MKADYLNGMVKKVTDSELAVICFVNEFHRKVIYRAEKYQMLHGVRYQKDMSKEHIEMIRGMYPGNCFEAAYELKTYYAENGILSNTIVLKMRPEAPEIQEFATIKVHNGISNADKEYTHHAIEVFKEQGKYKVLDILHTDEIVWLETYLDELCKTNQCERNRLRYDFGYLAPCHAFADNMQEISDLMRFLDKRYNIGQPRLTLMNLGKEAIIPETLKSSDGMLLSDDIAMDFDSVGDIFGYTGNETIAVYRAMYGRLMTVRFNLLHQLCLSHIMRDPIMKCFIAESIFDDAKISEMIEYY